MEYRLNRYISSSGYCSRREADKYIEDGRVSIDKRCAQIGERVLPGQRVVVNGELIINNIEPVYIAFNKPVGVVSTTDGGEKDNMISFIRHEQRIFPIGRLDKDSQGLILLTNDGDIVNKILRAGNKNKKEYIVTVNRPITPEFMAGMAGGVPILDRVTRKCELEQINSTTFKIRLEQGLNRQIRRMCEHFAYNVVKLERIQVMNIQLGKLGQGNWRDLTLPELETLFDLLEGAENEDTASVKRKSPSTLKHQAERGKRMEEEKQKKKSIQRKKKQSEEAVDAPKAPRSKKGNPKAKQPSEPSGLRIGKQRSDTVSRRSRTQERKHSKKK